MRVTSTIEGPTGATGPTGTDNDRVVPLHPAAVPEVNQEERARRLRAEVERLAGLSKLEWMLYVVGTPGYAEGYGVDKVTLQQMVEAVIEEREKKERADKAEQQRIENRTEKQRTAKERKEREEARLDRQAKKEANRKAEKRDRERQRELAAIAKLPKAEHAAKLAQLARRLGEDLDALHAELELRLADAEAAIRREAAEPWPDPVDTRQLLDETLTQIRCYVVVHNENAAIIYALSVLFAWVHDEVAVYSPIFVVQGPDIDSGKSLMCRIHSLLTPRPYMLGKPTGPAIYRTVDHCHPTMYIDNGDRLLARDRDAADVVDLSWTRGTLIPRQGHNFDPFCFKMINGIDVLPHLEPSTRSRCITTEMLPKLPGEKVIDSKKAASDERFSVLRRKAMRWLKDNVEAIRNATPKMPEGFDNRLAENYTVMFAIADLAGGEWPEKIRTAAVAIAREHNLPSMGRRLLAIFHDLFSRYGKLLTSEQVERALPGYGDEWANYRDRGRPINKWEIAALLRPFKIRPDTIHPRGGKTTDRGYDVAWFEVAFRHYLGKNLPAGRSVVRKRSAKRRRGK